MGIEDNLVRTVPSSHAQPSVPFDPAQCYSSSAARHWRPHVLRGPLSIPDVAYPSPWSRQPAVKPRSSEASRSSTAQERSQIQAICAAAAGETTARLFILRIASVGQNHRAPWLTTPARAYVMLELIHSRQQTVADISGWQHLRVECVFTTQCFYTS